MERPIETQPAAVDENIDAIKFWERAALHERSAAERTSEAITRAFGSGTALVLHVAWYAGWLLANSGRLPGVTPFDPFPFPLLTTVVSLEAIFLSLFVLASQNRMTRHSDKRTQLDLQVNMLAEREMTAVLVLLQDIIRQMNVKPSLSPSQIKDLARKTDIEKLTHRLEELPSD